MTGFLARAVVDFDASRQWDDGDALPSQLPAELGPFRLDKSPNADLYFRDVYCIDDDRLAHREVDWDYPKSAVYLDTNMEVPNRRELADCADRHFHGFELLLRLFQSGAVTVRRFSFPIGEGRGDGFSLLVFGNPVKSKVATSYKRSPYLFNEATLTVFQEFFSLYWGTLDSLCPSVNRALTRFSTSYERRELVDRLVDLVIALEALFNVGGAGSVTSKISTRCAAWLYPPGDQRESLTRFVKDVYEYRSAAVHGRGERKMPTADDLDRLEQVARISLLKFLDHQLIHGRRPSPEELDEMKMQGSSCAN
ncbi:MAG: HEPN domain-containing protein [Chloroflexi bacterium]|nr:HEPN domain-containing protein [Chloroflexota bacterium]